MLTKQSFAEQISSAQVMCSGMQNNAAVATGRGWTADKNEQLNTTRVEAATLNDEQEKLKAELAVKTAELNAKMNHLGSLMKEAKQVVKVGFQQAQWKEFGITDKR